MSPNACPSDEQLSAFQLGDLPDPFLEQVAEHLDRCPRCESRSQQLDGLVDPISAAIQKKPANGPPPPVTRPNLRGYEIIDTLGRGGMAIVYKARHVALERLVALKMIPRGAASGAEDLARFRNEAEAVARLQHPNLVQIFEIGEQEGELFLALEYVSGGSLEVWLAGRPQPPRAAAALTETLARAIHYAHERGVIHRDLKPANILLNKKSEIRSSISERVDSDFGLRISDFSPKVSDFGLAKLDHRPTLTAAGLAVGTPAYMAPEQAAGNTALLGPRTDVFALGVILYEMLTGCRPFSGATTIETLQLVQYREPAPPRASHPDVPLDLQTICLKCLEKEPGRRYVSARALADDLRRFLDGETIVARPASAVERAGKWARRQPLVAALVVGLVATGLAGMAGVVGQWRSAVRERDRADGERQVAIAARGEAEMSLYFSRLTQARLGWRLDHDAAGTQALLAQCRPRPGEADRRGWEWHYLQGLLHAELLTLAGPPAGMALGVAFSPDGRVLACAGGDLFVAPRAPDGAAPGEVVLWDAATGRPLRRLAGHTRPATGLAFSAGGDRLVSAGLDGTLRVWEVATGQALATLRGPSPVPRTVAISPDGKLLLSGHADGQVCLWDVAGGGPPATLAGHTAEVFCVAFSPDGRHFASGSRAGACELLIWDARTRAVVHRLGHRFDPVQGLDFSPDGRLLAAAAGRAVTLWDVSTGRPRNSLVGHQGKVAAVAFRPDGRQLASVGADRTVRLWNASTGAEEGTFRGHRGRILCVAYHPAGHSLASGDEGGTVKVWDLTRDPECAVLHKGEAPAHAHALAFADDGSLQVVYADGRFRAVDPATGLRRREHVVELPTRPVVPAAQAAFSGDGRWLATVSGDDPYAVQLLDAATGRVRRTLESADRSANQPPTGPPYLLALSHDGRRLAACTRRTGPGAFRRIQVWDTDTGYLCLERQVAGLSADRPYGGLALSADGAYLAFDEYPSRQADPRDDGLEPGDRPRVQVCEVAQGGAAAPRWSLPAGVAPVHCLAFSPDGRHLCASTAAAEVLGWDLETGQPLYNQPRQGLAFQLAFSPDGKRVAGVSREQVKIWDVPSGQELLVLQGAPTRPSDNAFNPQLAWSGTGGSLAASNWNRTVSVWDAADRESPEARAAAAEAARCRRFAWHLSFADRALATGDTTAFGVHWQQIGAAEPPDAAARLWRGRLLAAQGQWTGAAAEYGRVLSEHPPEDAASWACAACFNTLADDSGAAGRHATALWQRFGATVRTTPDRPLIRDLALAICDDTDAGWLLTQARAGAEKHARPSSWDWHALALAHYRAGNAAEARHCGRRALDTDPRAEARGINYPLLALAAHQLGQQDEARKWLREAEDWLRQVAGGKAGHARLLLDFNLRDGLTFLVLHREARLRLEP